MKALVFLALMIGVTVAKADDPVKAVEKDFTAEVMVQKWKYDFGKDKWEKKWVRAKSDEKGVYLKDDQKFAIRTQSNHAYFSNVKVVLDGVERGVWKMKPWQTGFLDKGTKGKPFVFRKGKGKLSIEFESRHTNDKTTIRINLLEES